MPTGTISCRPSRYRKSAGNSSNTLSSVEPGLPNHVVNPCERNRSMAACRTVVMTIARLGSPPFPRHPASPPAPRRANGRGRCSCPTRCSRSRSPACRRSRCRSVRSATCATVARTNRGRCPASVGFAGCWSRWVSSGFLRFVENAAAKQFHGGVAAPADDVGGVAVSAEGAFDRRPQQQRPEVQKQHLEGCPVKIEVLPDQTCFLHLLEPVAQ